jgi:outer membrane protein with beta-barrel domain
MRNLKMTAVCLAAAGVLTSSATAEAQPFYNWGGFYFGAHAGTGFGSGNGEATEDSAGVPYNAFGDRWEFDLDSGGVFGAQAGYSVQRQRLVFGIEGDIGSFGFDGSGPSALSEDTVASSEGGLGVSVRGRVGYSTRRVLVFATAGVLTVNTTASVVDDCSDDPCGQGVIDISDESGTSSAVFGFGVEYALPRRSRVQISLKGEWLHASLDDAVTVSGSDSFGDEHGWDVASKVPRQVVRFGVNVRLP